MTTLRERLAVALGAGDQASDDELISMVEALAGVLEGGHPVEGCAVRPFGDAHYAKVTPRHHAPGHFEKPVEFGLHTKAGPPNVRFTVASLGGVTMLLDQAEWTARTLLAMAAQGRTHERGGGDG